MYMYLLNNEQVESQFRANNILKVKRGAEVLAECWLGVFFWLPGDNIDDYKQWVERQIKKNLCVSSAYWAKDLQKRGRNRDLYSVLSYRYQLAPSAPHFLEPPAASLLRDTGQKNVWSVRVHFTAASGACGCLRSACRRQSAIKNEQFGKSPGRIDSLWCAA